MLSATRVNEIFLDCLFKEDELLPGRKAPADAVIVEGIRSKYGFHRERLESHCEELRELLAELPDNFWSDRGGGWWFLNACMDRNGRQWGEHVNIEQLLSLGLGLKLAAYCLPRREWHVLPGGMPYFVIFI